MRREKTRSKRNTGARLLMRKERRRKIRTTNEQRACLFTQRGSSVLLSKGGNNAAIIFESSCTGNGGIPVPWGERNGAGAATGGPGGARAQNAVGLAGGRNAA